MLKDEEMTYKFRKVFSSRDGQDVLLWILRDCGALDAIPATAEAVTLRNWGIRLLTLLGGGELTNENIKVLTHAVMRQPINHQHREEL